MIRKLTINYAQMRSFLLLSLSILFIACGTPQYVNFTGVGYQSIAMQNAPKNNSEEIPKKAEIAVLVDVDADGEVNVVILNNTDKIMTIDRTKSFFRQSDGLAQVYYNAPTTEYITSSNTEGSGSGIGVNLGAVAGAVGGGGVLGRALSGVTVGGNSSNATTTTTSKVIQTIDQPAITIPAHSKANMGKTFKVEGIGTEFLRSSINQTNDNLMYTYSPEQSYTSFTVMIYYTIENKKEQNISTNIYANSLLISKPKKKGAVNDALREMYLSKPDVLDQPWYIMCFKANSITIDDERAMIKQGKGKVLSTINSKINKTTFINYK